MSVETGVAGNRHDEVYFAVGMAMMGAGKVFHVDNVDRKTVEVGCGLDDAAVAHATTFILTHPSFLCRGSTGLYDALTYFAIIGKLLTQFLFKGFVEGLCTDKICYL